MRKRYMTIIGSVLVVVCLFFYSPLTYAAQEYPNKTSSGSSGDVAYYSVTEFRGAVVEMGPGYSGASGKQYFVIHVDLTFRNTSSNMAVGQSNNFRFSGSGFDYKVNNASQMNYSGIFVQNISDGLEIYDIQYNPTSNTNYSFTLDMHPTYDFVLEPESKRDFSFDICIPFLPGGSAQYYPPISVSSTTWSSATFSWSQFPTFDYYTMTEYAAEFEGFWPYLLRLIENFTIFNFEDPDVQDKYEDIADESQQNTSDEAAVHSSEEGWYQDANNSLADVNLSGYQFSQDTSNGLSWLNLRFIDVWNVLGPFNIVPVVSLMLLLATQILRHRVGGRRDG